MGFVNLQGTKSKTGKKTDQAGEKENDEDDANDEEEGENAENQFYHNSPPSHVKVGRQFSLNVIFCLFLGEMMFTD